MHVHGHRAIFLVSSYLGHHLYSVKHILFIIISIVMMLVSGLLEGTFASMELKTLPSFMFLAFGHQYCPVHDI
jgi:hypothetical protein